MRDHAQVAPLDRYVVVEYLAEGGMGAIYLGKKLGAGGFEKQVVLKQLLPEFTRQPEFIDLFLREARLSASLDHANIIHTIDLVTAGEEHFIVMEYLDGADLRTLLKKAKRRKRRIPAAAALFIAREVLSALAYAHNKVGIDGTHLGLIHRDISPSNVLISGNGEVKLTDFGIAKASTHNSVFYRVKGKIGYMSPEQARSEDLDARSDLYSLAVCLYELLTGERLFVNVGITVSADEMYGQPIPRVSSKGIDLPAELDEVMLRALSVDPDRRYQSAAEFQEAIIRCAHRNGLMMSAPELADALRGACGPPGGWRDVDNHGTSARIDGTEIYDEFERHEGTEQLSMEDLGEDADMLQLSDAGALLDQGRKRRQRQQTSITHLGELKGLELTSMLPLGGDEVGSEPLIDIERENQQILSHSGYPYTEDMSTDAAFADDPHSSEGSTGALGSHSGRATIEFSHAGTKPAAQGGGGAAQMPAPAPMPQQLAQQFEVDNRVRSASGVGVLPSVTLSGPDQARAVRVDTGEPRPRRRRRKARKKVQWIVIVAMLIVGVAAAVGIGLTGPTLPAEADLPTAGAEQSAPNTEDPPKN